MFPRLIEIGHWTLYSYGVILWTGAALGLCVSGHLIRRRNIDLPGFLTFVALALCAGIAGARLMPILLATIDNTKLHWGNLLRGGSVQLGLITAGLAGYFYARKLHFPVLAIFDLVAPGLAIGLSIARLGCFAAGCCFGVPTHSRWGVTYTDVVANQLSGTLLGVPLVPTQLIDSSFLLFTSCFLLFLTNKKHFDGKIVALFLILLGTGRGLLEYVRGDRDPTVMFPIPIDVNQYLSIGLVFAGIAILILRSPLVCGKSSTISSV